MAKMEGQPVRSLLQRTRDELLVDSDAGHHFTVCRCKIAAKIFLYVLIFNKTLSIISSI
jgi:hypothetical protein